MRFVIRVTLYVALLLTLVIAGVGCQTVSQGVASRGLYRNLQYQQITDGGWLTVFLNLKEFTGPQVSLHVSSVEIQAAGTWLPLYSGAVRIDSGQLRTGQMFVARNMLQAGEYGKLRFNLSKATIKQENLETPLTLVDTVVDMDLPKSLDLAKGDSKSLFVSWDVQASLTEQDSFKPSMKAKLQSIPLLADLSFVACPKLDTVYVIRTDRNWVISSIGIQGEPTYLDVDTELNYLYILAKEQYSIMVYDLNTNSVIDKFYIPMDNEPSFMFLSPDKQFAYLLDQKGKGLAKVNLLDGILENEVIMTFRPAFGFYIEDQGRIALSAADLNKVYLLNPDSLQVVQSFPVGNNPQGLVNYQNLIFVAESTANTITSYSLVDGRKQTTVYAELSPYRLLIRDDQIYSTNLISNSVTVFTPGQLTDMDEIRIGGRPVEIATIQRRFYIYVGNDDLGGLTVIDQASNLVSGFVDLAASPLGLAMYD